MFYSKNLSIAGSIVMEIIKKTKKVSKMAQVFVNWLKQWLKLFFSQGRPSLSRMFSKLSAANKL